MCTLCTLRRPGPGTYTASVVRSLAAIQGHDKLVMLPLEEDCLGTMMENTFDQFGDIFGSNFNNIEMEDDSDDQNLVNMDSRLDVESVLIEDIKFDLDAMDSRLTDYGNHQPEVINSMSAGNEEVMAVSGVIKSELKVENDQNIETLLCPQQRDRCNTWPRQFQAVR